MPEDSPKPERSQLDGWSLVGPPFWAGIATSASYLFAPTVDDFSPWRTNIPAVIVITVGSLFNPDGKKDLPLAIFLGACLGTVFIGIGVAGVMFTLWTPLQWVASVTGAKFEFKTMYAASIYGASIILYLYARYLR